MKILVSTATLQAEWEMRSSRREGRLERRMARAGEGTPGKTLPSLPFLQVKKLRESSWTKDITFTSGQVKI